MVSLLPYFVYTFLGIGKVKWFITAVAAVERLIIRNPKLEIKSKIPNPKCKNIYFWDCLGCSLCIWVIWGHPLNSAVSRAFSPDPAPPSWEIAFLGEQPPQSSPTEWWRILLRLLLSLLIFVLLLTVLRWWEDTSNILYSRRFVASWSSTFLLKFSVILAKYSQLCCNILLLWLHCNWRKWGWANYINQTP